MEAEETNQQLDDNATAHHKWYVLQVMSAQEKKTKKSIDENQDSHGMTDFISEVLLPTENVAEVKKGQQTVTEKRLWPGYLLIKMELNDRSWSYIKETNGVIDFLGGGAPTPLSDGEVKDILDDLHSKKEQVTQKHKFAPGDPIRIIDGVFANFQGTVLDVYHEKGRLSVMVSIFDRETRVDDLEFWQVEEATEEE